MVLPLKTGPEKTTEIHAGSSVFQELTTWLKSREATTDSLFILTDTNTRSCCLDHLLSEVPVLKTAALMEIPAGEKSKSIETCEYLWKELAAHDGSRRSLLLNLGGGVITDLGGFVASTFSRGIPFVHIPTTLLGMVDAAVGGKNGINLGNIKNQVGTFQQPEAIFIYTGFLGTQDASGLLGGFAELIKTALVADAGLWKRLATFQLQDLLQGRNRGTALEEFVSAAVTIKCKIVEQDFREKNLREILNFGHTIGHAFESISLQKKGQPLSHGHAVALGMLCETWLSGLKTGLAADHRDAIIHRILPEYEYFPVTKKQAGRMMDFIGYDKKRRDSGLRFSLLKSPGHAVTGVICTPDEILASVEFYRTLERFGR